MLLRPQMFLADAVSHFVTETGWRRVAMAVCADVYCEGLAEGIKAHLAVRGIVPLFEETIPAGDTGASDGRLHLSKLKAGFERHWDASCADGPDLGPPIVVLCAHADGHHLLAAETEQSFQPVWIAGEGMASSFIAWDLAAMDAQNTALFMARPVDPAVTEKRTHLASQVASQDQWVPIA